MEVRISEERCLQEVMLCALGHQGAQGRAQAGRQDEGKVPSQGGTASLPSHPCGCYLDHPHPACKLAGLTAAELRGLTL